MIGAHRNQTGEVTMRRDEHPLRRKNPVSGEIRWVARWTDRNDKRNVGWKDAGIRGTHAKRGPCKTPADDGNCCAQHAIYACYERDGNAPKKVTTVGSYAETWLAMHPRSERTNFEHGKRLGKVLGVELEGVALRDWPMGDVSRWQCVLLVDVLLSQQGRATGGAQAILSTLSAMWQDALDDQFVKWANPFFGLRVRKDDPRAGRATRVPALLTWEQMYAIARAAGKHEPLIRAMSDCGLRKGEAFALQERDLKLGQRCDELGCAADGPHLHVRRRAWRGTLYEGTKTGVRISPLAPDLAAMLAARFPRPQMTTRLLFATSTGRVWQESNFHTDVWSRAVRDAGVKATPHDLRHGWVSYIRAAGVDVADAAAAAGHTVETASKVYTHSLGRSFEAMRAAVGA